MTSVFFLALGLVFIFEGLLPFLVPNVWRRAMQNMLMQSNRTLRIFGLSSMLIGLGLIYLTKH